MAGLIAWDGQAGGPATAAPGLDPYVLTVGAVDADGAVPAWSGRGHDFAGRAKPGPGGAGRRAGRAARPRLDPSTSSPIATSTPRPTRRCGCGCGATAAGRWRPWPTGQRPLARLDLHRAAAAGLRPRGRRGHRCRRARPRRRHPAAKDRGPAPRRPPLPLLVTLSPCGAVVHNPRVDRAGGERGATAVAYAVMVAILALLLVSGIVVLSGSVGGAFDDAGQCVATPSDCEIGGSSDGGQPGGGSGGTTSTTNGSSTTTSTTSGGP